MKRIYLFLTILCLSAGITAYSATDIAKHPELNPKIEKASVAAPERSFGALEVAQIAERDPMFTGGVQLDQSAGGFIHANMVDPNAAPISQMDFISLLLGSMGGLQGAKGIAIVALIIQLLIGFLKTDFANQIFSRWTPLQRLCLVSIFGYAGCLTLLMKSGVPFGAALIHATTVNALMVYGNQILQKYLDSRKPA